MLRVTEARRETHIKRCARRSVLSMVLHGGPKRTNCRDGKPFSNGLSGGEIPHSTT